MSGLAHVDVKHLREFRQELKAAVGNLDDLKEANVEVANLVVESAVGHAFTPLTQKASNSLRAVRSGVRAAVSGGGAGYEFFGGAEFGALQYPQFDVWRGNGESAGYFLYPAIRAEINAIIDIYGDAIEKITDKAFPN